MALSAAEDALQSVAERAAALRERGVFFGGASHVPSPTHFIIQN